MITRRINSPLAPSPTTLARRLFWCGWDEARIAEVIGISFDQVRKLLFSVAA